jgi:small subunit ribosomal protein S4
MPPGQQSKRRRRVSDYGRALMEKQKIRHFYGMTQRQLARFFGLAKRLEGNTGENLLILCERRLDNMLWRAGFAVTRAQSRQSVAHGHVLVNGIRADVPSYLLQAGDTVQVRKRDNLQKLYESRLEEVRQASRPDAGFLAVEKKDLLFKLIRLPDKDEVGLQVNINLVVELLSR